MEAIQSIARYIMSHVQRAKIPKMHRAGASIVHRRASFDFEFLETLRAGVVLEGWEVKPVKRGEITLEGSYVFFKDGGAFWAGAQIPVPATVDKLVKADAQRTRKLLLNKREIASWALKVQRERLTVAVQRAYLDGGRLKLDIALAKGKNAHDKRQASMDADMRHEAAQAMKHRQDL